MSREENWKSGLQREYSKNWAIRALSEVIQLDKGPKTSKEMSDYLGIPEPAVLKCLELLVDLGVIGKEGDSYKKIVKYVSFSDQYLDPEVMVNNHTEVTQALLENLKPISSDRASFYRTSFLASNKELAQKYMYKMENLLKEFLMESERSEKNTIFAVSLTAVELGQSPK